MAVTAAKARDAARRAYLAQRGSCRAVESCSGAAAAAPAEAAQAREAARRAYLAQRGSCRAVESCSGAAAAAPAEEGLGGGRPQLRSDVLGVCWVREKGVWRVQCWIRGLNKRVSGGCFRPTGASPAEVERARLLAEDCAREVWRQHAGEEAPRPPGAPRTPTPGAPRTPGAPQTPGAPPQQQASPPSSGVKCVAWDRFHGTWHVTVCIRGKTQNQHIRPQDSSPEAIERARLEAIDCRRALLDIQRRANKERELDVAPLIAEVKAEAKGRNGPSGRSRKRKVGTETTPDADCMKGGGLSPRGLQEIGPEPTVGSPVALKCDLASEAAPAGSSHCREIKPEPDMPREPGQDMSCKPIDGPHLSTKCDLASEAEPASSNRCLEIELEQDMPQEPDEDMSRKPMLLYVVGNTSLEATSPGLPYFMRKDTQSENSTRLAAWGSTAIGCSLHDGWLETEHGFLPMTWKNNPVLTPVRDPLKAVSFNQLLQLNPMLAEVPPVSTNLTFYKAIWQDSPHDALRLMRSQYSSIRLHAERPFQRIDGLQFGSKVQVLSDSEVVVQACRHPDLSTEDESRCKALCGKVAWVLSTVDGPGMYAMASDADIAKFAAERGLSEAFAAMLDVGHIFTVQELTCCFARKQLIGIVDGLVGWIPVLDLVSGRRWATRRAACRGLATVAAVGPRRGAPYVGAVVPFRALAVPQETPFQSLDEVEAGEEVQVLSDGHSVLEACRAAGIPARHDTQRLASLGRAVCATDCDPIDGTVQCAVPDVGHVWLAAGALTTGRFDNGRMFRHEVKKEVKQELETEPVVPASGMGVLRETPCGAGIKIEGPSPGLTFEDRIPLWIRQCREFQKQGKTCYPGEPCCMPNLFIEPVSPPPKGRLQPCFHRLTREQEKEFRAFAESRQAKLAASDMAAFVGLLHPELAAERFQNTSSCWAKPPLEKRRRRLCDTPAHSRMGSDGVGASGGLRPLGGDGASLEQAAW